MSAGGYGASALRGSCLFPQEMQSERDSLGPLRTISSKCAFTAGVRILTVSERRKEQGEASVSALSFLLMLNAIVFAYDHSKRWWRENVWRRVAKGWSSLDA